MPHSESLKIMNMMDFIRKSNNIRFAVDDEKQLSETPAMDDAQFKMDKAPGMEDTDSQLPDEPSNENTQIQTVAEDTAE
jgi:hypothetical protein